MTPLSFSTLRKQIWRTRNVLIFVFSFLFDVFTIKRIDSLTDLAIQLVYLGGLTFLLVYQYREHKGVWTPRAPWDRVWRYNVEALHFFYGGLLSAYVVLYAKSSAQARPLVFFALLVALLVINEMPQVRRFGHRLRLGLYAFCVASFLIYFIPVAVGRMGTVVFCASLAAAGWLVWKVAGLLSARQASPRREQRRLFLPAAGVLSVIFVFYVFKLVPPVPLSVKYQAIYHSVEKRNGDYFLRWIRRPWYAVWKQDSRPFLARPGDEVHYFVSVFAPRRFRHQVMIRWEHFDPAAARYVTTDRMALRVSGGREQGYRGFAVKANYQPGSWRVRTETEDGRTISRLDFTILADASADGRRWYGGAL